MMQFAEALHDNPEGRKFDSRLSQWDFSLIQTFRQHYVHGLTEMSIRNISCGGGKGMPVRRADNPPPYHFYVPIVWKYGSLAPGTFRACEACTGIALLCIKYLEVNNFLVEGDLPNGYKQESETWTTEGHWPYRVAAPHKQTNADSW